MTREEGIEHLNKQIISVVTLMNISDNWNQFKRLWDKKFGQQVLAFDEYQLIEPIIRGDEKVSPFDKKLKKALDYDPKGKSSE